MKRVVLSCVLVGLLAAGGLARQWSDAAGTSRVEAEYAGMSQGTVVLEKPDGKNVYVPLDKLSQADRQYVESGQAERDRKARGAGAPAEPADEAAPKENRYARFDKLIEEDPDNPANYVRRGQAKAARGEHAEAIKDFNLAISQDPNFAAAYDGRGSSRAATGDPVGAHKDFSRAIELDPNFATAYRHRGDNLRALAKTDEGEELFQQVKERFQKKYHYKRKNTLGKHSWQPYNSTTGNVSRGATAMQLAKVDYDMARGIEQRYPRGGYGGYGGRGGPGGCGPGGPGSGCACGCGPNCTGNCCCGPSCGNNGAGEAPDSKLKLNPALAVYPEKVEQGQTVTLVANANELSENMPQKIGPDGKPLPAPKGSKPGDRPKEDIQSVDFYRDVDGDGKFDKDGDQYLATDDEGSDGYTAEVSTKALPPGQQAYFAVPKGGPQPEGQADSKTQEQIDALRKAAAAERAVAEQSAKAAEGEGYSPVQAKSLKQTQLKDVGSVAIKAAKALKQTAPEAAKLLSDAGKPIDETTEQLRAGEQSPGEPSKAAAQEAARQATAAAEKIEEAIEKLAEAAAASADQGDDAVTGQAAAASGEIVPPAPAKAPGPGGPGSGPGGPGPGGPGTPGDRTVAPIVEDRVPEVIDRALGYLDDDDYGRAIPELNRLVVHDPDNDVYLRRRAGAYLASGGYDYAVRDYDRLITRYAGSADLYYNRGCAYLAAGQLERALADFTKSVELNETWNLAYNNRGTTLARMGKYRQAIADFNKAIDIDADDHLAYSNRALAYKKLGETEKAKADFARARELRDK